MSKTCNFNYIRFSEPAVEIANKQINNFKTENNNFIQIQKQSNLKLQPIDDQKIKKEMKEVQRIINEIIVI